MFLATDITASTLAFNYKISTTETTVTMFNWRYLVYNKLLLPERFPLLHLSGLSHKGITDLQCTCNKNTIVTLECISEV